MLFYLASLQSIPTDVYEAAAIDGAGTWRTFWKITFPLLKPGHFFVAVLSVIGALKLFDQAFIVSGGGRRAELLDAHGRALPLPDGDRRTCDFGYRGGGRDRAVRDHLHADADPALLFGKAEVRLMATDVRSRSQRRRLPPARRSRRAPRPSTRARVLVYALLIASRAPLLHPVLLERLDVAEDRCRRRRGST